MILPASTQLGNPAEETLLPQTVAELGRLAIKIREVAVDDGFKPGETNTALADLDPRRCSSLAARNQCPAHHPPTAALPHRRGGPYSHLKRGYGLDRSRLKGDEGRQIWTEWTILAYNTDTLAVRKR